MFIILILLCFKYNLRIYINTSKARGKTSINKHDLVLGQLTPRKIAPGQLLLLLLLLLFIIIIIKFYVVTICFIFDGAKLWRGLEVWQISGDVKNKRDGINHEVDENDHNTFIIYVHFLFIYLFIHLFVYLFIYLFIYNFF